MHAFKKKLDFWKIGMHPNDSDCVLTIKYISEGEEVKIIEVFIKKIIEWIV